MMFQLLCAFLLEAVPCMRKPLQVKTEERLTGDPIFVAMVITGPLDNAIDCAVEFKITVS